MGDLIDQGESQGCGSTREECLVISFKARVHLEALTGLQIGARIASVHLEFREMSKRDSGVSGQR